MENGDLYKKFRSGVDTPRGISHLLFFRSTISSLTCAETDSQQATDQPTVERRCTSIKYNSESSKIQSGKDAGEENGSTRKMIYEGNVSRLCTELHRRHPMFCPEAKKGEKMTKKFQIRLNLSSLWVFKVSSWNLVNWPVVSSSHRCSSDDDEEATWQNIWEMVLKKM